MGLADLNPTAAAEKGADLHLNNPMTGKPLFEDGEAVTIRLIGRDSAVVKEKRQDIERRRAKGEEITDEQMGIEVLCVLTVGWSKSLGMETAGDLPFSPANARRLYEDPRTAWIAEQVGPFTISRRNFAGNLPKN